MFEKMCNIIANQLKVDGSKITKNTRFIDDLRADSLDIVQLLISLEEEFGLEFSDDEITKIKTVGDVEELIKART